MDSISNLPYFSCQGFKSFYALISHPYLSIYTFYMFYTAKTPHTPQSAVA